MAKCIRCGKENLSASRICRSCLHSWLDMRTEVFNKLQEKYGKFSPQNQEIFKKQMKRLENIWKKDKDKFVFELEKL